MERVDTVDILYDWMVRWAFPVCAASVVWGVLQDWGSITVFTGVFNLLCSAMFVALSIWRWRRKYNPGRLKDISK